MSFLCYYWLNETTFLTFGSTIPWWDLQLLCFQSDFAEHETSKNNISNILLKLILNWLRASLIQIRQCGWEPAIYIDMAIWKRVYRRVFKILMESVSSVSEHSFLCLSCLLESNYSELKISHCIKVCFSAVLGNWWTSENVNLACCCTIISMILVWH